MMAESAASAFEQIKHTDEFGEYWLARELESQHILVLIDKRSNLFYTVW